MPYWRLFYHIVWATKNREPILVAEIEATIYGYLRAKAVGLGAVVFALDGWWNHVHMVAAIPPSIAVSKFIGQVKAAAGTKFNKSGHPKAPVYWQAEYAVFSFDEQRLPNYVSYVEGQKELHANKATIALLERITGVGVKLIRESEDSYSIGQAEWREEFDALE